LFPRLQNSLFVITLPSDVLNPGLVQGGTKCGPDMVCQDQQCMNISDALHPPTCPVGSNGQICSGSTQGVSCYFFFVSYCCCCCCCY